MRALLEDATYNPQVVRWENREEGVFRIVPGQSKSVARLWGIKKNNPTMTFDKLSRSLRYYCLLTLMLSINRSISSDVNKDLGLKAKAKAKDSDPKAKAKART